MPTTAQAIANIKNLIGRDELPAALQQLRDMLANSSRLDEVLQLSGRFESLRRQVRLGTLGHAEANITQNQIRAALLELVDGIEPRDTASEAAAKDQSAISVENAKNTVIGSTITAGGDVHIGDKIIIQQADKIYNIDKIDNANFS